MRRHSSRNLRLRGALGRSRQLSVGATRPVVSRSIARRFPPNPYVQSLVRFARQRRISLEPSPVPRQWMYHPGRRAILAWLPDLRDQSLSYLVMILAHELGHALDFDRHPGLADRLFAAESPELERAVEHRAFVGGFFLLQRLGVPVSLRQYLLMIEEPMASAVGRTLGRRLCSLLDREDASGPHAPASAGAARTLPPPALPPVA
ncbi:hypothetical protein U7230_01270 [Carboxydochorda subterranea]|uniref:Peptidase M48 domain-containing protein n=1 Tax=Carboxydichorda subterranea TaxID=3109565 RepID=A0ABZ1BY87_9FIRM|nr:hypothetical protein [Limnochorda sp. L945t]WRP17678.1 hypothetical protein U7230_01270 [Limnochorda sp. L945t]